MLNRRSFLTKASMLLAGLGPVGKVKAEPVSGLPFDDDRFYQSTDGREWARMFVAHVKQNPSIPTDEATMTGWFANAIMRGWDAHDPVALKRGECLIHGQFLSPWSRCPVCFTGELPRPVV